MVRLNDLINIYEKDVKINVKNKKKIYDFEKHKIEYLVYICDILNNNLYQGCRYNLFLIKEPKVRLIMSESIIDKIINHYVAKFILEPKSVKYLSDCNVATRKGMGLDYGIKLLKKYIERNKKYKTFYFLKLDISKYFYNIDHNVLKSLLIFKLEKEEYELVCKIIDSTNYSYINNYIDKIKDKEIRKWHAKEALENDWSVSVLSHQISSKLYERLPNLNQNMQVNLIFI